jgi:hypothetical protein
MEEKLKEALLFSHSGKLVLLLLKPNQLKLLLRPQKQNLQHQQFLLPL